MGSLAAQIEDAGPAMENGTPSAAADIMDIIAEAKVATTQEHEMSLWQGLKLYPKAIGWSVLLSTAIIMEGYGKKINHTIF